MTNSLYNDDNLNIIRKRKKKKKKVITTILLSVFLLLILFTLFSYYIIEGLPPIEELENPKPHLASKVFTVDGELLGQFFIENRIETDIDSIPKHLINALIATEDRKFYDHWGVDMDRLAKAIIQNIVTLSKGGGGASTVTQQLAKNLYNLKISRESFFDTVVRKIREWLSAIQIERNFTKKEILELYLNVSYFGKSAFGVESAANVYFDKRASALTVPESALLIALLKSSVYYDPERRYESAVKRRNLVMLKMVETGFLSEEDFNKFKEEPIVLAQGTKVKLRSEAPHFLEHIRQQMSAMAHKYGYDLYRDGLSIYTSLDMRMQKIANAVAADHLKEYQELFNKNWKWENNKTTLNSLVDKAIKNDFRYREAESKTEKEFVYNRLKNDKDFIDSVKIAESTIQVGFVILDAKNGQIRAMVGGENQEFFYGLNHVTQIRRQPGSAFKPFVYTVAIDNGYFPAYSLLNQKFDHNGWSPSNSDNAYGGYMTFRRALALSVNVIAGRLTISDIAPPTQVIKYAKRMGINSQMSPYPSIALGTFEVTPLELTSGFATLANKGIYVSPISILRIENKNGMVLDEFKPEHREAISPQTAAIVVNMMQDVLNYGTGARARQFFHRPAAGKTGTTQDFADAWFVGFTPQLVGGVWTGFDDRRVRFNGWYGQGARASMPIWAKFMERAYKEINLPLEYFELPEDITTVSFCRESVELGDAKLATSNCPERISDIVYRNKIPGECTIHSGSGKFQRDIKGTEW